LDIAAYVSEVLVALLQLFLGFVFSISAISAGISLLDRLTKEHEEWELIKKGKTSVGILYGAVVLSIIVIIEPVLVATVLSVHDAIFEGMWIPFALDLLALLIATIVAIFSIYTILRVINSMSVDVDEFGEIMQGNNAMAILIGSMVFGISFVIRISIMYLVAALTGVV